MTRERFFPNNLPDWAESSAGKPPLHWDAIRGTIEAHAKGLTHSLSTLSHWQEVRDGLDGWDLYAGAAGIALLDLHHYRTLHDVSGSRHATTPLKTARQILSSSVMEASQSRAIPSFIIGQAGVHALRAVVADETGDQTQRDTSISLLEAFAGSPILTSAYTPSEVLYGRAGYLYACAFVNKTAGEVLIAPSVLKPVAGEILAVGRAGALALRQQGVTDGPPLMFDWHQTRYLGAAHGLTGIVQMLLLHKQLLNPGDWADVLASLDWLIRRSRYPSGNYASSLDGSGRDRLVQWCHGATGAALTLVTAYEVTGSEAYLKAARAACDVVWARGLLRKAGLCHGIAGNLYAFLALRRAELLAVRRNHADGAEGRAERALHRARAFGAFLVLGPALGNAGGGSGPAGAGGGSGSGSGSSINMPSSGVHGGSPGEPPQAHWRALVASGEMHGGDRPASLFEGAAGVAYALEDLLHPDAARFPGYEL